MIQIADLDDAVRQFLARSPGLHQQVRALAVATSAAGVRVRDPGLIMDDFDDNLKVYTARVVSSYLPTVRSLPAGVSAASAEPSALAVAMPETPGR